MAFHFIINLCRFPMSVQLIYWRCNKISLDSSSYFYIVFIWIYAVCAHRHVITFCYQPEAVVQGCSVKKLFLEISQNSQENTCAIDSFLIKLQASAQQFIKKESLAQLFFCEFCETSKNTFFTEQLRWLLLPAFKNGINWET